MSTPVLPAPTAAPAPPAPSPTPSPTPPPNLADGTSQSFVTAEDWATANREVAMLLGGQAAAPSAPAGPATDTGLPLVAKATGDRVVRLAVPVQAGGQRVTALRVRELTGEDEEFLGKLESSTVARYLQGVVERGVEAVEPTGDPISRGELVEVSIGDRDALLLAVRVATFGPDLEFSMTCQHCNASATAVYDLLTEVPQTKAEPMDVSPVLPSGRDVVLRPPTARTFVEVMDLHDGKGAESEAEANSLVLSRCLVRYHGVDVPANRALDVARSMGAGDRRVILREVLKPQAGPNLASLPFTCEACGKEAVYALGAVALFQG